MKFRRTTRYPGGALGEISNAIAAIQSSLEQLKAVYPIHLRGQGNSASIEFIGDYGGGGGGGSTYSSYFKVIDASTADPDVCKIGVTNGSAAMLDPFGSCGTVKINNERADVAAVTEALSAAGTYYVWIHCWIDAEEGPKSEIIVGDVDDDDPPDNVNAGIAFSSQLAGRVQVTEADGVYSIAGITQDYLRGGEYETWLWGDCTGLELEE